LWGSTKATQGVALGLLLGNKDGAAEEAAVDGLLVTGALVGACEGATLDAESVGDKDGVLLGVPVCSVAVGLEVVPGAMEGMVVGAVVVGQTPVSNVVVGPVLVTKTSFEPLLGRKMVPVASPCIICLRLPCRHKTRRIRGTRIVHGGDRDNFPRKSWKCRVSALGGSVVTSNLTMFGTLSGLQVKGDVTIAGNLSVDGTTFQVITLRSLSSVPSL